MVVAVEKGMADFKLALSMLGYFVVDYEDYEYPVDAIVYESVYLKPCSDFNFIGSNNH